MVYLLNDDVRYKASRQVYSARSMAYSCHYVGDTKLNRTGVFLPFFFFFCFLQTIFPVCFFFMLYLQNLLLFLIFSSFLQLINITNGFLPLVYHFVQHCEHALDTSFRFICSVSCSRVGTNSSFALIILS